MKHFYLISLLTLVSLSAWSQESTRVWEYHLSKVRTYEVVRGNQKIFFLSEGGIFYYDQKDSRINTITKIDGLSGSDFSGIEYSQETNSLVVFYQSSMVDIYLENGQIIPISDIKRKNISGNKSIYSATCYNDLCYLSCGFGIVVLDLVKHEIKDSFIIGNDGNYEAVYDIVVDNNSIYAATSKGIKFGNLDGSNLLDFSNWEYIEHKILKKYPYKFLTTGFDRIWAIYDDEEWSVDRAVSKHDEDVWYYEHSNYRKINSIYLHGRRQVVTGMLNESERENAITIYDGSGNSPDQVLHYFFSDVSVTPFGTDTIPIDPRDAIVDAEGIVWIADYNYGAIRYENGSFTTLNPGGPIDNGAFKMHFSGEKLWVTGGGYNKSWDQLGNHALFQSYVFTENNWEPFNKYTVPMLIDFKDVIQVLPTRGDPNRFYVATWGGGIIEFDNSKEPIVHNETNSSLINISPGNYYTRIGGMDFDSNGNLWVSNSEVEKCIHMRKPGINGEWLAFETPEIAYNYKVGKILVTQDDNIWMIVPREKTAGLYVMSNDGKQKKQLDVIREFDNTEDQVYDTKNNVFDIVEDNDGNIWVGTSKGIAIYQYPDQVFVRDPMYARQTSIDVGDNNYHPLLQNQTVTAIAIDGGNRKWCGTKRSGIYLISANGTEELEHFTTENSKLISDGIVSLEYDGVNGILYVGTDRGLVSFHTESKQAFPVFTNVYAYPNPVRSGHNGDIYITGMMEDTNVKITTVSGQLVFETTSVGGQATWDGRDIAGRKVHTGVYIVFCASKDGQESAVTKILFIR
ncbi:MAG: T9SS type A sorting domain-containing protein [Prolixibacteraceae bacterium]|jgi:hypothetical protein|nr:T9SS type A sorting domain-containing protein [Prolixibacteraceae bacterium]